VDDVLLFTYCHPHVDESTPEKVQTRKSDEFAILPRANLGLNPKILEQFQMDASVIILVLHCTYLE